MSNRRSRLLVGAEKTLLTKQYFSDDYKAIIKERDKSFYNENQSDLDNFSFVINKYTGDDYWCLNDFLREGKVQKFSKSELKSWAYCLHSSLQFRTSNVKNGTVVYRGVKLPAPKDWKVGKKFYFAEFISTSLNVEVAKGFATKMDGSRGPILVITIKNNGNDGRNNYCRYVEDITTYKGEEEVLITAFCIFKITKIDGNTYYLDCEGY